MAHVLIIEDEPDTRTTVAMLIEARGLRAVTAQDGDHALRALEIEGVPSLILLDLMLPGMSGWQLRVKLLGRPELARVPIVLMSGLADIEQHAKVLRVADYLPKPFDTDRLYEILDARCADA